MVKRALLIGNNYTNSRYALRGCINDIYNLRSYLLTKGYEAANIRLMNDVDDDLSSQGILTAIRTFVSELKSGDIGIFHFSGHGGRVFDIDRKEYDGYDECIYSYDKNTRRVAEILDDTLRLELVDKLAEGVKLRCILDCCHSGTGMDLPYFYYPRKQLYEDNTQPSPKDVVCISGCKDAQESADAFINGTYQGALTASLLLALYQLREDTWEDISLLVDYELRRGRYTQISVLSFTHKSLLNQKVDI